MSRTIHLHIGTEKTGTTTLQQTLAANRASLLSRGYLYPVSAGRVNHILLTLAFAKRPNKDLLRAALDSKTVQTAVGLKASLTESLDREVAGHGPCDLILSNEHLSSRLETEEELVALRSFLDRYSRTVRVIVYLRRQDEVLLSLYSTWVKIGHTEDLETFAKRRRPWLDYSALLGRWSNVFGRSNLVVRVFEREQLKNGKLEDDFFDCVRLAEVSDLKSVRPRNVSLDRTHLEFLRLFNECMAGRNASEAKAVRGNLIRLLERSSTGPRLALSPTSARRCLMEFEESNHAVARSVLHREDGILFRAPTTLGSEGDGTITARDLAEITVDLWIAKQGEIKRLERKIAALGE